MPDNPLSFPSDPWVIKPQVLDEIFTDRSEFLEYFYETARKAATRRAMSTVLLGQRRMGKTEIFRRVVNRLFFEQDPQSPDAVVPVYFSFPDTQSDPLTFALKYVENFMRYYFAFHTRRPEIIRDTMDIDRLIAEMEAARTVQPRISGLGRLLGWYKPMREGRTTNPQQDAVEIPRRISDSDDSTIVVFLDEFQNTHLPHDKFRIVGYMQNAVESYTCPHFVTGSAMSILAREILGRGALFGRFRSKPIEELSGFWGAELVKRAAHYYDITVPEVMAPIVAERCGGNPFYIAAVVQQAAELKASLVDEESINSVLAIDISSGFIWAELYEQVNGWIGRINEHNITKWILYLSAQEEERKISLERIQRELKAKEGTDVSLEMIREVLVRLSRGDLLDYKEFGNWFHGVDDPILLEFIKVWGRVELEGQSQARVRGELDDRYRKLARRIHDYKGYLAEVFMAQVLLSNQNHRKQPLPGRFFNSQEDIQLPTILHYLNHRVQLSSGKEKEVDILAAYSGVTWVCQSKWVTDRKVGVAVLQAMLEQVKLVQEEYDPIAIQTWLFAHEGLTEEAKVLAQKECIFWSNREQLDGILAHLGL
ncbi:hypothetical protein KFU94_19525, partial [Chloroflexi bacterium TSY]|nr:hypothetical protein [Chloroflexi bacterium TSY]